MNASEKLALLFALGALAVTPLSAAVESIKVQPTFVPRLSPAMQMEGVTNGSVVFAIEVSETGALTDVLVLGTTHPALVAPCAEALKEWEITPARLDGRAVPVQAELTIHYRAEGVVVSQPSLLDLERHLGQQFGHRMASERRAARDLDNLPSPIATVTPVYPAQAEQQGVRGNVRVHFYIDESGSVRMPAVVGEAHPYLAEQAIRALREWRFAPPVANGKPVLVAAVQEFNFRAINAGNSNAVEAVNR